MTQTFDEFLKSKARAVTNKKLPGYMMMLHLINAALVSETHNIDDDEELINLYNQEFEDANITVPEYLKFKYNITTEFYNKLEEEKSNEKPSGVVDILGNPLKVGDDIFVFSGVFYELDRKEYINKSTKDKRELEKEEKRKNLKQSNNSEEGIGFNLPEEDEPEPVITPSNKPLLSDTNKFTPIVDIGVAEIIYDAETQSSTEDVLAYITVGQGPNMEWGIIDSDGNARYLKFLLYNFPENPMIDINSFIEKLRLDNKSEDFIISVKNPGELGAKFKEEGIPQEETQSEFVKENINASKKSISQAIKSMLESLYPLSKEEVNNLSDEELANYLDLSDNVAFPEKLINVARGIFKGISSPKGTATKKGPSIEYRLDPAKVLGFKKKPIDSGEATSMFRTDPSEEVVEESKQSIDHVIVQALDNNKEYVIPYFEVLKQNFDERLLQAFNLSELIFKVAVINKCRESIVLSKMLKRSVNEGLQNLQDNIETKALDLDTGKPTTVTQYTTPEGKVYKTLDPSVGETEVLDATNTDLDQIVPVQKNS